MTDDFSEIELRRLDLNLLLVFAAVMRAGSVKAAARRLHIGPSGISMAIARLRAATGQELFCRGASGLEPTAQARALYARLAPALSDIDAALRESKTFDPAEARRVVQIAMSDDVELVILPRLIARLAVAAPEIRLVVRAGDYRGGPALLDSGEADLLVSAAPAQPEGRHHSRRLYREHFRVLCNGVHGIGEPLTLERYLSAPHALVSAAGAERGLIDAALAEIGQRRRVTLSAPRFATLPSILRAADMFLTLPARPARSLARAYGLACLPLPFDSPQFDVACVWHRRTDDDPCLRWIRDEIAVAATDRGLDSGPDLAA